MSCIIFSDDFLNTFYRIFDKIPIPVILVDEEGKVQMINEAFANFLNKKKDDIIGRHATDVDKNSRWPIVLKTGEPEIAYRHKFAMGKEAIVHRIPIKENGKVIGGFAMVLFENIDELKKLIEKNQLLETELKRFKSALSNVYSTKYSWENIIGWSEALRECKETAKKMAKFRSNILITGESGVGKELIAHAIHNDSDRREYPFVRVNCAAIPENLLESELFGYEEGAFTGAQKGGKIGKFELANKGTIFLDEIGDMPLNMQAKILRVLQEQEVERIGGTKSIKIDVRVIAATNRNLEAMIAEGKFRSDLYYRLNVLNLRVPSLRERREDIPILIEHFLYEFQQEYGISKRFTDDALDILIKYNWPGNIRELKNIIERLVVSTNGDYITKKDIPVYILKESQKYNKRVKEYGLKDLLAEVEKEAIIDALKECNNNKSMAAELLKIPRSRLYRKIEEYGI